jgi:NAD(P)-dependent dehydrogenase (short-subunit alcohol dehydrogenase family)
MDAKRVIVTGAGSGMGRAVAGRMLAEGASVAALDVNPGALDELKSTADDRRRLGTFVVDVASAEEVSAQLGAAIEWLGGCDVLVNVAGVTNQADALEITEAQWDQVMDVNVKGTFLCSQVAGRAMRDQGGGNIVNISSIATDLVVPHQAHYAASKGAVRSLTKGLAVALAPHNIRVNAVSPGPTMTAMAEKEFSRSPEHAERMLGRVLRGRLAKPDEIAAAVLFLASDEADFITGATLVADGGVTVVR